MRALIKYSFLALAFAFLASSSHCFLGNEAPSMPQYPLNVCRQYKEASCCKYKDSNQVKAALAPFEDQCQAAIENLFCGVCSPEQDNFVSSSTFFVCENVCESVYNSCKQTPKIAKRFPNAKQFCESQEILGLKIKVATFGCFSGDEPSSPERSTLFGFGLNPAFTNYPYEILIQTRDRFGNDRITGGDEVTVVTNPPVANITISDRGNGLYSIEFMLPSLEETSFSIFLNGKEIANSPTKLKAFDRNPPDCIMHNDRPKTMDSSITACPSYQGLSCMRPNEEPIMRSILQHHTEFCFSSRSCLKLFEDLTCKIFADPRQGEFLAFSPEPRVRLCDSLCDSLYSSLSDVNLEGCNCKVKDNFTTAESFCQQGLPKVFHDLFAFTITDEECVGLDKQTAFVPNCEAFGEGLLPATIVGKEVDLLVQLKDEFGNNITSDATSLDAFLLNPKSSLKTPISMEYKKMGLLKGTYRLEEAGIYYLFVQDSKGTNIRGSPFRIVLFPSLPSAARSIVTGKGISSSDCFQESSFKINLMDSFGNALLFGENTVSVQLSTGETAKIVDNGDGTFSVSYTSIQCPDNLDIAIFVNEEQLEGSPFRATVSKSKLSELDIHYEASGPGLKQALAGERATFFIDSFSHSTHLPLSLKFKISFEPERTTEDASKVDFRTTDFKNGTYRVDYTLKTAGTYEVNAWAEDFSKTAVRGLPSKITVLPGTVSPIHSTVVHEKDSQLSVGSRTSFTIVTRDAHHNLIRKGGAAITLTVSGEDLKKNSIHPSEVNATIIDNHDGTYHGMWTPPRVGRYVVSITDAQTVSHFHGSPRVATTTEASASSYIFNQTFEGFACGGENIFFIQARTEFGELITTGGALWKIDIQPPLAFPILIDLSNGTYQVTWSSSVSGRFEISVTIDDEQIEGSPFSVTLEPGVPSSPSRILVPTESGSTSLLEAELKEIQGSPFKLSILARDRCGNIINNREETWLVQLVPATETLLAETSNDTQNMLNQTISPSSNGEYLLTFSVDTPGEYSAAIFSASGEQVGPASFPLTVTESTISCNLITAFGPGLQFPASSSLSENYNQFTIAVLDSFGNIIPLGGSTFSFQFSKNGVTLSPEMIELQVNDTNDGLYQVAYRVPLSGLITFNIFCCGDLNDYNATLNTTTVDPDCFTPIGNSPFELQFHEGNLCSSNDSTADCYGNGICYDGDCICSEGFNGTLCEQGPAPYLTECAFSESGVAITCTFDVITNRGLLPDTFNCSDLLSSDTVLLLGSSPTCYWRSDQTFIIVPSTDASITQSDFITIEAVVGRATGLSSRIPSTIFITLPEDLAAPVLNVIVSQSAPGCENAGFTLDASSSTGTGGRPFVDGFVWSISADSPNATELEQYLSNESLIFLPGSVLAPGLYTFNVSATNVFGLTGETSFQVTKDPQSISTPVVVIGAPHRIELKSRHSLNLRGTVSAPCDESSSEQLSFAWYRTGGNFVEMQTDLANSKNIAIPPRSFATGEEYVIDLKSQLPAEPSRKRAVGDILELFGATATDSTRVVVTRYPVETFINVGNIKVSRLATIVLNGSLSVDAGEKASDFKITWGCIDKIDYRTTNKNTPCFDVLATQAIFKDTSLVAIVPPAYFGLGIYEVTLSVIRKSNPSDALTFTATLNVVHPNVPYTTISLPERVNAHETNIFRGSSISYSNSTVYYRWTLSGVNLSNPNLVASNRTSRDLVLKPFVLLPGVEYTLTLEGTDYPFEFANGRTGSSTVKFIVNEPPLGGQCRATIINRNVGLRVSVRCFNWEDSSKDLPLRYSFAYINLLGEEIPVSSSPTLQNELTLLVPSFVNTLVAYIEDSPGAQTRVLVSIPQSTRGLAEAESLLVEFDVAYKNGQNEEVIQYALVLLSELNEKDPADTSTVEERRAFRDRIVFAVSTIVLETNLNTANLWAALARELTAIPEELSTPARISIINRLLRELTYTSTNGIREINGQLVLPQRVLDAYHYIITNYTTLAEDDSTNYKTISKQFLVGFGLVGKSILVKSGVGEESKRFSNPSIYLQTKRDEPVDLNLEFDDGDNMKLVTLDPSVRTKLASEISVSTVISHLNENVFSYSSTSDNQNSPIVGVSLFNEDGDPLSVASPAEAVYLENLNVDSIPNDTLLVFDQPICQIWDGSSWSSNGCTLVATSDPLQSPAVCQCDIGTGIYHSTSQIVRLVVPEGDGATSTWEKGQYSPRWPEGIYWWLIAALVGIYLLLMAFAVIYKIRTKIINPRIGPLKHIIVPDGSLYQSDSGPDGEDISLGPDVDSENKIKIFLAEDFDYEDSDPTEKDLLLTDDKSVSDFKEESTISSLSSESTSSSSDGDETESGLSLDSDA